jgi:DNA adenine methylase
MTPTQSVYSLRTLERSQSDTLRPPLKWAGGKRWLLPYIRSLWSRHGDRRLVEPFAGGLAVSIGLQPVRALINDVNPHLHNFYQRLKRSLTITAPLHNSQIAYHRARSRFNQLIADGAWEGTEGATLFYYLNRTGYNGLCRFNRDGRFNVPFGRHTNINYIRDFTDYAALFRDWKFTNTDFEHVAVKDDDFIYADPPYDVEFTAYAKDGFSWEDQVRAAEWLAMHPGPVVVSNQATSRIVELYRKLGFNLRFLKAPRHISCNGDRTPAREVLATKNI